MTLIVQISDLHLRPRGMPALRVSETNMFATRTVDFLNRLDPRPDGVIITGDLADTGGISEYESARDILSRLELPFWAIPGNHDDSETMKTAFSDHGWAKQMPGRTLQFVAEIGELRVIGLDTSVPGKPYGLMELEQLDWLSERLAEDTATPTLIALHHPPIETGIRHMDRSMMRDPGPLEAVLSGHGNIIATICGHQHRMIVGKFAGAPIMVTPGVAHQVAFDLTEEGPSAFVFEPPAAMFHLFKDGKLTSHMAYIEKFPGPYPFWPDSEQRWPGY